jgi:hypothetical protein
MPDAPDAHTAAMDRGAALLQDLHALRLLASLLHQPEVRALVDPDAHAQALLYVVRQTEATAAAMIDWQTTTF